MSKYDNIKSVLLAFNSKITVDDFIELTGIDFNYSEPEANEIWEALAIVSPVAASCDISIRDTVVTLLIQYDGIMGARMRRDILLDNKNS